MMQRPSSSSFLRRASNTKGNNARTCARFSPACDWDISDLTEGARGEAPLYCFDSDDESEHGEELVYTKRRMSQGRKSQIGPARPFFVVNGKPKDSTATAYPSSKDSQHNTSKSAASWSDQCMRHAVDGGLVVNGGTGIFEHTNCFSRATAAFGHF